MIVGDGQFKKLQYFYPHATKYHINVPISPFQKRKHLTITKMNKKLFTNSYT